jgi:hypothetical protein
VLDFGVSQTVVDLRQCCLLLDPALADTYLTQYRVETNQQAGNVAAAVQMPSLTPAYIQIDEPTSDEYGCILENTPPDSHPIFQLRSASSDRRGPSGQ